MKSINLPGCKAKFGLLGLALCITLVGLFAAKGTVMFEASSTCQETVKKCHGVYFGNSCYGVDSEKTEIVEKSKCDSVSEIQSRCNQLADEICSINDGSIGTKWSDKAVALGQTCSKWNRSYNISLRSC